MQHRPITSAWKQVQVFQMLTVCENQNLSVLNNKFKSIKFFVYIGFVQNPTKIRASQTPAASNFTIKRSRQRFFSRKFCNKSFSLGQLPTTAFEESKSCENHREKICLLHHGKTIVKRFVNSIMRKSSWKDLFTPSWENHCQKIC